jgi:hypothetical protein
VTYSLPGVIGAKEVRAMLEPSFDQSEHSTMTKSMAALQFAAQRTKAARR